jgi:hypothetical protein
MLRVPTVFVIGAGAGVDVGMPLGDQLSRIIGEKLRIEFREGNRQTGGDELIMEAIRKHAAANQQNPNLYRQAAFSVAGGIAYSRSIDSYLHAHKDNKPLQVCGKLAIAQTILEHEKRSALVVKKRHEFRDATKVNGSWLRDFVYGLQERIVVNENLGDIFKHLTIVNFNYDRCVEHFLFHAIQAWSLKKEHEVAELMKGLNIYHPYGSVGDLPWQSGEGIEFGSEANEFRLLESSSRIRTFNEEVEDKTKIEEIRKAIATTNRVIFFGVPLPSTEHGFNQAVDRAQRHHRHPNGIRYGLSPLIFRFANHRNADSAIAHLLGRVRRQKLGLRWYLPRIRNDVAGLASHGYEPTARGCDGGVRQKLATRVRGCEHETRDVVALYAAIIGTSAFLLNLKTWFDSGVKLPRTTCAFAPRVQPIFCRRRHQPRRTRPPLAKIRPSSPPPSISPVTVPGVVPNNSVTGKSKLSA